MRNLVRYLFFPALLAAGFSVQAQKTGLLIIDIQEFYFPGGKVQLVNPEAAGMNAGLILNRFREARFPVYHVRHAYEPGGSIHPYVKPVAGEPVFTKQEINAFLGTGLLEQLRNDSIRKLIVCGMQTHMCVEAAVRAAHDLGFDCVLVGDACATRSLQHEELIIPAESVHFSTIEALNRSYARITTTADLLRDFPEFTKINDIP